MNKDLQDILEIIQQSGHLSNEEKSALSKAAKAADKKLATTASKLEHTEKAQNTTSLLLKETAAELEQKRKIVEAQNRELEIESSLERVRTVAMSMNKADDMLRVCRVIAEQLQHLHVQEIRNVQTAIFYEAKGTYINYEFYAKHDKTVVTEVNYKDHPVGKAFADQMIKGPNEIFIHSFKGKEVQDWYEYQKTTNVFIDTYLEKASSLNYYWHSLGPVALGMSTYNPLSEEETNLFKRFLKVFELSYRRYLDIEKAEAQAHETQIQLALERVRARTMAMHRSDELQDVASVLFQQVKELGIETWGTGFNIWEEDGLSLVDWMTGPDGCFVPPCRIPLDEFWLWRKSSDAKRRGEEFLEIRLEGDKLRESYEYLASLPDLKIVMAEGLLSGLKPPEYQVNNYVFFPQGSLLFITHKPQPAAHDIFKRFGKVFEQTYTRFLDLQKAEAQAREAKIEVALERTRTQSMLMQQSKDLDDTLRVFHEQVSLLGIKSEFSFLWLPDEKNDRHIFWAAWAEDKNGSTVFKSKAINYPLDRNEPATAQCLVDWKSDSLVYSYAVPPGGVENYFAAWKELIDGVEKLTPKHFDGGLYYVEAFMKYGCFGVMAATDLTEDDKTILGRFAVEFERTYTRFLDLQKAEEQARESQVELALERVRARALAMHTSQEFLDVANVLREQMRLLGQPDLESSIIHLYNDIAETFEAWYAYSPPNESAEKIITGWAAVPKDTSEWAREVIAKYKSEETEYTIVASGNKIKEWYNILEEIAPATVDYDDNGHIIVPEILFYQFSNFSGGSLLMISNQPASQQVLDLQKKAAVVLGLAYTRFLDLQKAEAQAREAQIELGLERVRAKAMAMQKSDDLARAVAIIFEELDKLNIGILRCGIGILSKENRSVNVWTTSKSDENTTVQISGDESMDSHPLLQGAFNAWLNQEEYSYVLHGKDLTDYYKAQEAANFKLPESQSLLKANEDLYQYYFLATFQSGGLFAFRETPFPEEAKKVMKRFAGVFNLTYKRFLDLQKAEAQAREAQIEAALERVRSRSMGMQKSDELSEVSHIINFQLQQLNFKHYMAGFLLDYRDSDDFSVCRSDSSGLLLEKAIIPYFDHPVFNTFKNAKETGLDFYTTCLTFDEKNKWVDHALPRFQEAPPEVKSILYSSAGFASSCALLKNVGLFIENFDGIPFSKEENAILMRFGKVFEQTYTRFLDLQKAEEQAREAHIEAALERVRSRSMAMQKSDELKEVIQVVYEQFVHLNIHVEHTGFIMDYKERDDMHIWLADHQSVPSQVTIPYFDSPHWNSFKEAKEKEIDFFANHLTFEEKNRFYQDLFKHIPGVPEETKEYYFSCPGLAISTVLLENIGLYIENHSGIAYSDEENATLMRFGKVFQQTYTRFLDLQKAEAQALEAIKRSSVDRVRAEIASMRTTNDLEKITPLIWSELTMLGVPFIRCGVFIMDEELQQVNTLLSNRDGKAIAAFHQPFNTPGDIAEVIKNWRKKEVYRQHWGETQFNDFTKGLVEQGAITSGEKYLIENRPTDLYLHFLPFLQGMMYVGNTAPLTENTLQSVQDLANAFSTAYARYEDFNKLEAANIKIETALLDLKQTQSQLVQAEKMASLGELTAGIAHEIQNPLNFVNNFSELNKELLEELNEEIEKGNYEEVKIIAKDVIDNEEKISHHGKRADGIVKGMLQHSRSSSATKEPTDINQLADEYLRLSYHGLRAKDNSFNATLKTDYDESIGTINIIPQDIGRVILNLLTNAFYAVAEKKKKQPENYDPKVSISTKKIHDTPGGYRVELTVKDNGNGIPQKVLEKIFQPFFTTKPTGQGTGLGLSLSYDIVKAHGGELKVETTEGDGTAFIIQLPVV